MDQRERPCTYNYMLIILVATGTWGDDHYYCVCKIQVHSTPAKIKNRFHKKIHREFLMEYVETKGYIETYDHSIAWFLLVQETSFDVKLSRIFGMDSF